MKSEIVFIFTNLFNIWPNFKKTGVFSSASAFSLCNITQNVAPGKLYCTLTKMKMTNYILEL